MFKDIDIVSLFLLIWFPVSLLIFAVIGWNYLEGSVRTSAYSAGLEKGAVEASGQIYNDIINKSANQDCNTVFIQYDGRRVDLINVQCLQILNGQDPESGAAGDENADRG
ncbi:MAG: hypothetical protein ACON4P_09480 [Candidatus Puniceispirillales bacterium]